MQLCLSEPAFIDLGSGCHTPFAELSVEHTTSGAGGAMRTHRFAFAVLLVIVLQAADYFGTLADDNVRQRPAMYEIIFGL